MLRTHIFEPLGMDDTGFHVGDRSAGRLAALDGADPVTTEITRIEAADTATRRPPTVLLGSGGLVSTLDDYLRFAEMLRRRGEYDGVRVLGPRTVDTMNSNHLPGGVDIPTFGQPMPDTPLHGMGNGLGVAVTIDPAEDLTVVFMTQLAPIQTHSIRRRLRQLVHQALLDR